MKRTRLPKGDKAVRKERLKRFEQAIGQPPVVISEGVGDKVIKITTWFHKPLTSSNLKNMVAILQEKADAVGDAVGENWFPCGFASLWVDGNSPLVNLFKKEGYVDRGGDYRIDGVGYIMKAYKGGYTLSLDLPARTATEQQSLNYKTPLYQMAQKMLAYMGVSAQVRTAVD